MIIVGSSGTVRTEDTDFDIIVTPFNSLGTITLVLGQLSNINYKVSSTIFSQTAASITSNSVDISACGDLVTEFLYSSGAALTGDPFSNNGGFSVYTTDVSKVGTHDIRA